MGTTQKQSRGKLNNAASRRKDTEEQRRKVRLERQNNQDREDDTESRKEIRPEKEGGGRISVIDPGSHYPNRIGRNASGVTANAGIMDGIGPLLAQAVNPGNGNKPTRRINSKRPRECK